MDYIIPILTIIFSGSFSWIGIKWLERRSSIYDNKKEIYINLLSQMHVLSKSDTDKINNFLNELKILYLIGNAATVKAAHDFISNYSNDCCNKYKNDLALNMRIDLINNKYTWIERKLNKKKINIEADWFKDVSIN